MDAVVAMALVLMVARWVVASYLSRQYKLYLGDGDYMFGRCMKYIRWGIEIDNVPFQA